MAVATPHFQCSSGDIFDIEFDYYITNGVGNTSNSMGAWMSGLNSAGTQIWNNTVSVQLTAPKNVWATHRGRIRVDGQVSYTNTKSAFVYFQCQPHSSQPVYIRNPRVYRAAGATQMLTPGTGRATSGTILSTSAFSGLRYVNNSGFTLTQANAGSSVTVTAGSMSYTFDDGRTITYNSTSIGGLAYSTFYYFAISDPNLTGGAGYVYSTNLASLSQPGFAYVGYISTMSSGGTGGGGGGGGREFCVDPDAYVETQDRGPIRAREIVAGDRILALTEDHQGVEFVFVEANLLAENLMVDLVGANGAALRCAVNTPVPTGWPVVEYAMAINATRAPVLDMHSPDTVAWTSLERSITTEGFQPVSRISCGGRVYAAGMEPGRYIFTHNAAVKP